VVENGKDLGFVRVCRSMSVK